ncbi:SRA stem-loop-interacting RNA-binding protein, mitochondrial-like [Heterocephalus glaber]|uniref:SRA stem-loop-interacting RNA-binding protein, mitochondrial-like n=1 Tax=Heterocephalus glaber TaxID=10181 RepID=A0AAX6SSF8_HETGA|nr:SRA stem-loop-interacting RNA-binding protein, mitochondrial-like [Heterocephalus glaber]
MWPPWPSSRLLPQLGSPRPAGDLRRCAPALERQTLTSPYPTAQSRCSLKVAASVARGALALRTNFTRQVAFVRKIPWTATANELRKHFAQFGHIRKCILPFDKETGFHKGMCWIYFSSEEALQNAVQHENHISDGVKVHIQVQKPKNFQVGKEDIVEDNSA